MAHFAEIDENNIVIRVLVTDNNDPNGDEGYQWLVDNLGGRWIQTSYNAKFRGKFAAIGDIYDEALDVFDTSPEAKQKTAEIEELLAKRSAILEALADAAGLNADEVKAVLG